MQPQEELEQLLARQEALNQELKAKKKELQDAQRRQRDNLQKQIRRAQARISAAERKRRTRRLILMGSYLEHVTQTDSDRKARLMKGLDVFLERDRDRELFDLPNKENEKGHPETAAAAASVTVRSAPLPGWRPHRLDNGEWGSIYLGDTAALPPDLVGANISVQSKDGQSWTTTVTAVLEHSGEQVIVTDSGRPSTP